MKGRSIRNRLMVGSCVLITLVFAVSSLLLYLSVKKSLYDQVDRDLGHSINMLATEVEIVGPEVVHEWMEIVDHDLLHGDSGFVQVWDEKSGRAERSRTLGTSDLTLFHGELNELVFQTTALPDGRKIRMVGTRFFPAIEGADPKNLISEENPQIMVVSSLLGDVDAALKNLILTSAAAMIVAAGLTMFAIHFIIQKALLPIVKLEKEVSQVDVNDPKDVLDSPEEFPSELSGLVEQYRLLLGRISKVRMRERDFSANAAHELRTPLTGIQATLEQVLSKEREVEDYQQRVRETLAISIQMRRLVDRLMRFSRLQNGTEQVFLAEVNLHAMIDARLCALESEIESGEFLLKRRFFDPDPVVLSDEALLTIMVGNLLGNAVAHGRRGGCIMIETRKENGDWILEIVNELREGEELDAERIFEPFFTGDASHSSDSNHSGIGLSLSREIAKVLGLKLSASLEIQNFYRITVNFSNQSPGYHQTVIDSTAG